VFEGKSWKNFYTVPDQFIFSAAYGKAATIANAQSGFRKTGIWPIKAKIFEDFLFAPAEITNKHILNPNTDQRPTCDQLWMPHTLLLHLLKRNKL
jgi:hypothetical protein